MALKYNNTFNATRHSIQPTPPEWRGGEREQGGDLSKAAKVASINRLPGSPVPHEAMSSERVKTALPLVRN
jgi:hypothetical protein